jgi:hypothetical protein
MDSGDVAPRILKLHTRWRWLVSFRPWPLYLWGKSPWYPLEGWLGGIQSRSGRGGEDRKSFHCHCWELNSDRPDRSLVTMISELHCPLYLKASLTTPMTHADRFLTAFWSTNSSSWYSARIEFLTNTDFYKLKYFNALHEDKTLIIWISTDFYVAYEKHNAKNQMK